MLLSILAGFGWAHTVAGFPIPFRIGTLFDSGLVGYIIDRGAIGPVPTMAATCVCVAFFMLAYFIGRRAPWAIWSATALVVLDGTVLFSVPGLGTALSASLGLGFHAILCLSLINAAMAVRQWEFNERAARRLDLEARLRRRLEEPDGPPPPAATLDTRYRRLSM